MRSLYRTIAVLWIAPFLLLNAWMVRAASPTVTLNIEAQPLGDALNAFAQQTGLQLVFYSQIGDGFIAPALSGNYSTRTALEQLLANTPLSYEYVNERTIAIRLRSVTSQSEVDSQSSTTAENIRLANQASFLQSPEEDSRGTTDRLPLPHSRQGDASPPSSSSTPEIFVTGSRMLNMDIRRSSDDPQPYIVFDRATIENSGAQNIQDLLRSMLSSANNERTTAQLPAGGSNRSRINLRGLGTEQTLVLVDGRRMVSVSTSGGVGEQPDLNGIPVSAIERIEILPATASAIHGGSATGGVVNIIRRRDYSGAETRLTYSNSVDGGGSERRIDMNAGFNLEEGKTNILLLGSYSDTSFLTLGDRDLYQRGRQRILANNPSAFFGTFATPPLGYTTNIRSNEPPVNGVVPSLTLKSAYGGAALNSPYTFVPQGYAGPASDNGAGLVQNAGRYNFDLANTVQNAGGGAQSLLNAPEVKYVAATIRREFTPRLQAFIDVSGSRNEGSFRTNAIQSTFTLPASAANNPFEQSIQITTPAIGAEGEASSPYEDRRAVMGVILKVSKNWQASADFTWNRSEVSTNETIFSLSPTIGGIVSNGVTDGGTPFDVFADTNRFPADFSPYLGEPSIASPARSTLQDIAIRASGPTPLQLPGGNPTISLLAEHRKESLDDHIVRDPSFDLISIAYSRSQSIDSLYLETLLPIVSSANQLPGVRSLDVTLAVRREDYSILGVNTTTFIPDVIPAEPRTVTERNESSIDPTVALRYQPLPDITFRASYGTGFLPPSMGLLVPLPAFELTGAMLPGLTDPLRGNEPLAISSPVILLPGGNPDLRSEQSESRSVGIIVTPSVVPGLRGSADWIQIEKKDNVTVIPIDQSTFNNESLFPGVITRGPPSDGFAVGPIIGFNGRYINIARQTVEAYDLALEYSTETQWGAFTLSSRATRNLHNATQTLPTTDVLETVSTRNALDWQINGALTWNFREWTVNWAARYFDSYYLLTDHSVLPSQGSATVPSQNYHDLSVAYRFDEAGSPRWISNSDVQLILRNVFNTKPPIDVTNPLLYSTYGDPRLANYSISLRKSF